MRVLLVAFYFPPAGGGGVQRPLKLAAQLPAHGVETHVLTPRDSRWIHRDESLLVPDEVPVHRASFIGPRGRKPAEELYGRTGSARLRRQASLLGRRLILPDEAAAWVLTAVPATVRLIRRESIDVVVTTSPPNSNQLVGAAAKALTGVRWVADLRDPLQAHPHRDVRRRAVRAKESAQRLVSRLVMRHADAVVCVSEAIAADARRAQARGTVTVIANGADFEDFDGLEYRTATRFRITHAGSFFGRRDPRPFLEALARVPGVDARFVGDFRSADRDWLVERGLADRVELIPFVSHARSLELQRDTEALLLLIPEADGRGKGILSGKVFEYLAAGRPILALVPPDGAAAALLRELDAGPIVAPEDVGAIAAALVDLRDRWHARALESVQLTDAQRDSIGRRRQVAHFARLLESLD